MNEAEVLSRLELGEDSHHEFKSVLGRDKQAERGRKLSFAKALVAFANSAGGTLWLGVEDDGTISGVGEAKDADELMRTVTQICRDAIKPPLSCQIEKKRIEGQILLVVEVPGFSPSRPFRYQGGYYIRDGNRSREAEAEELRRLLESADFHFDEQPVGDAAADDLDMELVREFLDRAYQDPEATAHAKRYLRALHAVDDHGRLTVTGALFFTKEPTRWLLDARVTTLRFPGREITAEDFDRKEILGPLPDQLEDSVRFLEATVPSPARVEGTTRRELGIPVEVWREALANALAHRDYRMAAQVIVKVFEDRVEISNPGGLLNRLDLDGIRLGISQRRNPNVASILAKARGRENAGIGVPDMFRRMRERGLPPPEIVVEGGHFRLTLRTREPSQS